MSEYSRLHRSLPRSQLLLLGMAAVAAMASLIHSPYPALAPLQNLPTLLIVGLIAVALRRWPMPTWSVICLVLFLLLHTLGGRYIYSNVPYDDWARAIGLPAPTDMLGLQRNGYDRLVHFSFGLLFVQPISEWLRRHGGVRPGLALYIAVEFVFASSALYEIFEWLLTIMIAGPDANAYNGQQGDIWDAQKDMACAAVGALVCAVTLRLKKSR